MKTFNYNFNNNLILDQLDFGLEFEDLFESVG